MAPKHLPNPVQGSAHNAVVGYRGGLSARTGTYVLLFAHAASRKLAMLADGLGIRHRLVRSYASAADIQRSLSLDSSEGSDNGNAANPVAAGHSAERLLKPQVRCVREAPGALAGEGRDDLRQMPLGMLANQAGH